jgi:hypothetical protein
MKLTPRMPKVAFVIQRNLSASSKPQRTLMKPKKSLHMLIGIAIFGVLFLFSGVSGTAHASSTSTSNHSFSEIHADTKTAQQMPDWVLKAQPYVHIVNGHATTDPSINQHLAPQEIKEVKDAITYYNNIPLSKRHVSGNASITSLKTAIITPNISFQWTLNWYWWGARVWLNSPLAQSVALGYAIPAALLGAIPPVAALIALQGVSIGIEDYYCGYRGVFLDFPYPIVTGGHVTPVC